MSADEKTAYGTVLPSQLILRRATLEGILRRAIELARKGVDPERIFENSMKSLDRWSR